jgi:hypothetical protein
MKNEIIVLNHDFIKTEKMPELHKSR